MRWLLSTPTALEEMAPRAPLRYALSQNVPNPFNGVTVLSYEIPEDGYVRVEVFNILGQRQAVLVDRWQSAGRHDVVWDGSRDDGSAVASGLGATGRTVRLTVVKSALFLTRSPGWRTGSLYVTALRRAAVKSRRNPSRAIFRTFMSDSPGAGSRYWPVWPWR